MRIEDLHDGTIIWIIKSVLIMIDIDTRLRAPQGATMRVLMHKIVDLKYTIWSIKSVPIMSVIDTLLQAPQGATSNMPSRMSHHLGMARTVIDIRHHMSFAATSHFMIAIDQHLPRHHSSHGDDARRREPRHEGDKHLDRVPTTPRIESAHRAYLPHKATSPSCATTTMASTSSRAYGLRCYKCKQQGHPPRECPNLLCEVCKAKGHVAWQCTTPSAKTLYFDKLQAQVPKMPIAPTLQDEELQGHRKDDVDPSLALLVTTAPPLEDDLGGDGVEHGDHGILPSPMEAHGVEMVEHGNFPSTKEAHGDEKVEPTPLCFIDKLVPIPCENESHLAHLSESDSELSDFHPICEFECFRLEDMSDTQSELREVDDRSMEDIALANTLTSPPLVSSYVALGSTEDEFPLMETMYMVHEDDDISPCLLQDGHVDHMDPPTSTTPTSNESAFKGINLVKDRRGGTSMMQEAREGKRSHSPWRKEEGRRRRKEEEEEAGGGRPAGPRPGLTGLLTGPPGPRPGDRPLTGPAVFDRTSTGAIRKQSRAPAPSGHVRPNPVWNRMASPDPVQPPCDRIWV
ncbi:hypothetical protein QYE76_006312 [Lolium multiflorum]|uniref:CCHC-type domain-containing protein n=1 Tax=Lolium multiflorum TaxID=4521 RepID=A0AAD8W206_LOLMU|nr:hypothetical protein QYE76_006312 [Lolium multiflorum]